MSKHTSRSLTPGTLPAFVQDVITSHAVGKRYGISASGFMTACTIYGGPLPATEAIILTNPPSKNAWWMRFHGHPNLTLERLVIRHAPLFTTKVVTTAHHREAELAKRKQPPAR
jgi:hypothetical protein